MERAMTQAIESGEEPPRCGCGGRYRPNVVWFGEMLPEVAFDRAYRAAAACDLLVVAGTSARVYPAAGLIEVAAAAGAVVLEVNRDETPLSALAARSYRGRAGEVLPRLGAELERWLSPS